LALALWDAFPVAPGHALVVPVRHVASWFDLTVQEQADILRVLKAARQRVEGETRPDGFNIGINDGRAAGQTIFHAPETRLVTDDWIEAYKKRRRPASTAPVVDVKTELPESPPEPHQVQREVLAALEATRARRSNGDRASHTAVSTRAIPCRQSSCEWINPRRLGSRPHQIWPCQEYPAGLALEVYAPLQSTDRGSRGIAVVLANYGWDTLSWMNADAPGTLLDLLPGSGYTAWQVPEVGANRVSSSM